MPTIEEHKKSIKDFEEDIKEKIREDKIIERQKIIGFAASEGSVNCLALLLHSKNLITSGQNINHLWFASPRKVEKRFPFDFPRKSELLSKLVKEEELRQHLCYGKYKPETEVKEAINLFFEIKRIVEEETNETE